MQHLTNCKYCKWRHFDCHGFAFGKSFRNTLWTVMCHSSKQTKKRKISNFLSPSWCLFESSLSSFFFFISFRMREFIVLAFFSFAVPYMPFKTKTSTFHWVYFVFFFNRGRKIELLCLISWNISFCNNPNAKQHLNTKSAKHQCIFRFNYNIFGDIRTRLSRKICSETENSNQRTLQQLTHTKNRKDLPSDRYTDVTFYYLFSHTRTHETRRFTKWYDGIGLVIILPA